MSFNLPSLEAAVEEVIAGIPAKIARFLDKPVVKNELANLQNEINSLLTFAIPAVQEIESATKSKTLAEVEAVLEKAQIVAKLDPSTVFDSPIVKGLLLQAASAIMKANLAKALEAAGAERLKIAEDFIIKESPLFRPAIFSMPRRRGLSAC